MANQRETAVFAAGCFWGVEARFRDLTGVVDAEVGYCGGHKQDPTYHEVCTDTTGHAEACRVIYDPTRISFEDLLDAFFAMHDPTTLNRQGPDVGSQYRSAIFPVTPEQENRAQDKIKQLNESNSFKRPVVTKVEELKIFYPAEAYHQRYFDKMGRNGASCHFR